MQLAAKYKKPTIVARLNEQGYDRGSARGMNQSELKDFRQFLLESNLFEYAQGHANAFGISIPDSSLRKFHEYANNALANIDFGENVYDINFDRTPTSADLKQLITALGEAGGIWGQGNPEPIIHISNIRINRSDIRIMGSNLDTIKIEIGGIALMKFHAKDLISELDNTMGSIELEVVGRANLNEWGGRITPQLFIDDYEIKEVKSNLLEF